MTDNNIPEINPTLTPPVTSNIPPENLSQQDADINAVSMQSHRHHFLKSKNIFKLLPVIFILAVGVVGLQIMKDSQDIRSHASVTGTTLALVPATKTVNIGDTIAVGITMNTDTDTVSASKLEISYDPSAVQILGFTPGAPLSVVLVPETQNNGLITVTLGAPFKAPFHGGNIIGTLNVKILAAKQSSIIFTGNTQVTAFGKTTNALIGSTGSVIVGIALGGVIHASITPAPTSTACIPLPPCYYRNPQCMLNPQGTNYCTPNTPTPTQTLPPGSSATPTSAASGLAPGTSTNAQGTR
ncbi:MAG TPA: cohesin domain-containing protein [Patescibacteria group bacterium]|nr:cohesin domain-containing protein [Patescibacteria group bacterium]